MPVYLVVYDIEGDDKGQSCRSQFISYIDRITNEYEVCNVLHTTFLIKYDEDINKLCSSIYNAFASMRKNKKARLKLCVATVEHKNCFSRFGLNKEEENWINRHITKTVNFVLHSRQQVDKY